MNILSIDSEGESEFVISYAGGGCFWHTIIYIIFESYLNFMEPKGFFFVGTFLSLVGFEPRTSHKPYNPLPVEPMEPEVSYLFIFHHFAHIYFLIHRIEVSNKNGAQP